MDEQATVPPFTKGERGKKEGGEIGGERHVMSIPSLYQEEGKKKKKKKKKGKKALIVRLTRSSI